MKPGERPRILLVEDDPLQAEQMRWALQADYDLSFASDRIKAMVALETTQPDLVLLDLRLPPENIPEEGLRVLKAARSIGSDIMVIVMSADEERESALRAVASGAYDFFPKPVDVTTLRVVLGRALERQSLERENRRLRVQLQERFSLGGLVGISPPIQRVFDAIRRVADSPVTVILQGESGTGKELVARAIHFNGSRREGPFVAVHCAAIPETLLEAELFGHEKGAFTGAVGSRVGRFEAADGGTLFLDEIACINQTTQMKLLRVLETRTIEKLGSNKTRRVDIRLVVATNEDLEEKARKGEFREDLFFRVNVFPILLPPLRERRDDIPILADYFLKKTCEERGLAPKHFSPAAAQVLLEREWRGNVRELLNLAETLVLMADGDTIDLHHLPRSWNQGQAQRPIPAPVAASNPSSAPAAAEPGVADFKAAVHDFEERLLRDAIRKANGVKAQAARDLGLEPAQMKYLTKKYGL